MREIVNAILYQSRTGCQWDYLPHDLPPRSAACYYFAKWRDDGTDQPIHDLLRWHTREKKGRRADPSLVVLDTQSVHAAASVPADTTGQSWPGNARRRKNVIHRLGSAPIADRGDRRQGITAVDLRARLALEQTAAMAEGRADGRRDPGSAQLDPPIWCDDGTSVVVGRKRAYPVNLARCRCRVGSKLITLSAARQLHCVDAPRSSRSVGYGSTRNPHWA